ncbi:MAG: hypothetical protein IK130_11735 [Oscillospiraceae bacterium]|nr:hypothetical protein [Oscillospiraceae bacterium]
MKKRNKAFPVKKALSLFFGLMFVCNAAAGIQIGAAVASGATAEADSSSILEQAEAYLEKRINSDGSVGNSAVINDTADAVYIFRRDGQRDLAPQLAWLGQQMQTDNTDICARIVSATGNPAYLSEILKTQGADGGFGLNAGYRSDVQDTRLVLAAVNDCGGGELTQSGKAASRYLAAASAADGSYSYTETSAADAVLTADVLYDLSRFSAIEQDETSPIREAAERTAGYLRKNPAESYTDSGIEAAVSQQLALYTYDGKIDTAGVIGSLKKAQKDDGSFAESVHVTALAIRLLQAVNAGKYMNLTDFHTELSAKTVTAGESDAITGKTLIGYQSNTSGDYNVRMTVKNGSATVYENSCKVTIPEGEGNLEVESGEFRLIESEDRGITVTVDLLNGEKLIRSEIITLALKSHTPEKKTEVNAVTVSLDQYYTLTGIPVTVKAIGTVLYATNIDAKATVRASVKHNGKVLSENEGEVVLKAESNAADIGLFEMKIDMDEPGEIEFTAECIYDGKVIGTDTQTFTVVKRPEPVSTEPAVTEPVQTQPTDIETVSTETTETEPVTETTAVSTDPAPYFRILWMSPVLSDMVVYAGQKNDISGVVDIMYDSNAPFSGTLSLKAVSEGETVAAYSGEVTLEPLALDKHDGLSALPKYESESLISFVADAVGTTEVTAVLCDAEGKEISRASRTVTVIEKPVQDLILNADIDEKNGTVDLRWNDISSEHETYVYQLNRRIQNGQWEPRSIWNEEEHIRVLNVYPAYPYLADWMNSPLGDSELTAGMGIFEIESMHFSEFNPNAESVLKNADGSWKFDVIFFGSYDCNNHQDLSDVSYPVVQEFVDSGRGVLFGHDTVCPNFNLLNFCKFADQLGIIAKLDTTVIPTTSVSVVKIGTMTNYPWVIRGTLDVPACHSYGQYVGGTLKGTEWMTLNATQLFDEETGAHSNFYLVTNNNLGMIQTGHSNGQATDDERKVLANTLFYLYQISRLTTAKDTSFYDIDAPDLPETTVKPLENGSYEISAKSKDNGTTYEYCIVASPANGDSTTRSSNTITREVKSGLAGFVAEFSDSAEKNSALVQFDDKGDKILNLQSADSNGSAVIRIKPESVDKGRYIHVFAVDKANNISEEFVIEASALNVKAEIETDKKLYMPGETVSVKSETVVSPFGQTADGVLRITDEFDHPAAVLRELPAQQLTASAPVKETAEWTIPAAALGRYKAVITWEQDGEILAESETLFKISGEESIADTIASNKKRYASGEPVNLSTAVFNRSSNLVENDLTLHITVRGKESGAKAAEFDRAIASVNPQGSMEFADAIKGGTLQPGDYIAEAVVMQDNAALASDTAEFSVENSITDFKGTLGLDLSGKTVKSEFDVANAGSANAKGAEITVDVYSENGEQVFTVTKKAEINAGGKVQYEEPFSAKSLAAGNYSGVLSISYEGKRNDLAYAGFTVGAAQTTAAVTTTAKTTAFTEATTVLTAATEQKTAAGSTSTTAQTNNQKVGALQTGVRGVPWYIWTMLVISGSALVILKKTGGKKEHE